MITDVIFEERQLSDTVTEFRANRSSQLFRFYLAYFICLFLVFALGITTWQVYLILISSLLAVILFILVRYTVVEESVTVIRNFGIQLRTKYLFGSDHTKFLDIAKIEGTLIHEYIKGSQVRYCLSFIMTGESRMALLFNHLYPGFNSLQRVYTVCKQ